MTDQTTCSDSWTPPPDTGRHRSEHERPASRVVGAALVAGGLALSASLYPLPDGPHLSDIFTPDQESSSEASKVDGSPFVKYTFVNFPALTLPELVRLVELNRDFPDLATGDLLELVTTYGLSDVVKSLEVLQSFSLRPTFPGPSGGSGGARSAGSGAVLPPLVILLEYLKQNPPALSGLNLLDAVTSIVSTLAQSLGISSALPAPQPDAQTWALAAVAEFTAIDAPVSVLPDPSAAVSAGPSAPASADAEVAASIEAPADPPVAAVIEAPALAQVDTPVIASTEAPPPAPPEPSSAPEPTNVAPQEPDPPSSDPPSSDPTSSAGGGSGGSVSSGSGGASSGDSGGGSSGDSGGSSGGSGGGSSGGE